MRFDARNNAPSPRPSIPRRWWLLALLTLPVGAPAPAAEPVPGPPAAADKADHWAYKPLAKPAVPDVAASRRGLGAQPDRRLRPRQAARRRACALAAEADRRTLIRRLTFDLTGLPPTPEEVDASSPTRRPTPTRSWSTGCSPRPRYGERWARHWLDVVHYAETPRLRPGPPAAQRLAVPRLRHPLRSTTTSPTPGSSQEQLAGDVLYPGRPAGDRRRSGFLAAGPWDESSQREHPRRHASTRRSPRTSTATTW